MCQVLTYWRPPVCQFELVEVSSVSIWFIGGLQCAKPDFLEASSVSIVDSGCLWLVLAGSGWLWLALAGSGCLWLLLAGSGPGSSYGAARVGSTFEAAPVEQLLQNRLSSKMLPFLL